MSRTLGTIATLVLVGALAACGDTTGPAANGNGNTVALAGGSGSNDGRLEVRLSATSARFPDAKGKAKFRDRGGEQELQIEVENLAPGLVVEFLVDGTGVGSRPTNAFGDARINLNSDRGDAVPNVGPGTTVAAAVDGEIVAAGSF